MDVNELFYRSQVEAFFFSAAILVCEESKSIVEEVCWIANTNSRQFWSQVSVDRTSDIVHTLAYIDLSLDDLGILAAVDVKHVLTGVNSCITKSST